MVHGMQATTQSNRPSARVWPEQELSHKRLRDAEDTTNGVQLECPACFQVGESKCFGLHDLSLVAQQPYYNKGTLFWVEP